MSDVGRGESAVLRVTTSDPEEQAAFWRAMGAQRQIDQLGAGPFRGTLALAQGAATRAAVSGYNRLVHLRGGCPVRSFAVSVDLGGQGRFRLRGGPLPADAAFVRARGGEVDCVAEPGVRLGTVIWDLDALDPDGRGPTPTAALEAAADAGDLIRAACAGQRAALARLRDALRAVEDGSAPPWTAAVEACVRDDLLALVAGADPGGPGDGGGTASARRARRAEEFARGRLDRPVTLAELCGELGVGERTLRADFHARFGMGPIAYLRRLRLNGARRALRAGGRGGVTRAATEWGFCHFGEFSAAYKAQFGELPSETLRQARRRRGGGGDAGRDQSFARST